MEDSLTLFHALQKRGVILQENTASTSITQTLFDSPEEMTGAVRLLMTSLALNEGSGGLPQEAEVGANAAAFFQALNTNAGLNPHSAGAHRKFQCKINFSVPVHHDAATGKVLIAGKAVWLNTFTRQQTLPVELRISDQGSWEDSELRGEAHHSAYKCRQLLVLTNRLFKPLFDFPETDFEALRQDQNVLFS